MTGGRATTGDGVPDSPVPAHDETVHATCIVVGEAGILIRGPSGAGKSALAHETVMLAGLAGCHARLVGDDRVRLRRAGGRLLASPHPVLAGLLELRGIGLMRVPHEACAVVRLVADLGVRAPPRLPTEAHGRVVVGAIVLPRVFVRQGGAAALLEVLRATIA